MIHNIHYINMHVAQKDLGKLVHKESMGMKKLSFNCKTVLDIG